MAIADILDVFNECEGDFDHGRFVERVCSAITADSDWIKYLYPFAQIVDPTSPLSQIVYDLYGSRTDATAIERLKNLLDEDETLWYRWQNLVNAEYLIGEGHLREGNKQSLKSLKEGSATSYFFTMGQYVVIGEQPLASLLYPFAEFEGYAYKLANGFGFNPGTIYITNCDQSKEEFVQYCLNENDLTRCTDKEVVFEVSESKDAAAAKAITKSSPVDLARYPGHYYEFWSNAVTKTTDDAVNAHKRFAAYALKKYDYDLQFAEQVLVSIGRFMQNPRARQASDVAKQLQIDGRQSLAKETHRVDDMVTDANKANSIAGAIFAVINQRGRDDLGGANPVEKNSFDALYEATIDQIQEIYLTWRKDQETSQKQRPQKRS